MANEIPRYDPLPHHPSRQIETAAGLPSAAAQPEHHWDTRSATTPDTTGSGTIRSPESSTIASHVPRGRHGATRHATWLELFFDLVFVLAIAELAHFLQDHLTPGGVLAFGFLFLPVWSAWRGYSLFADYFELDTPAYRIAMFGAMLLALALAVTVHDALDGASTAFATIYLALRGLLVALYVWAWQTQRHRNLSARHALGFALGAACWAIALDVPTPWRFWLWGLGLLIELATPLVAQLSRPHRSLGRRSHLPERFGLFTILVLGEAIMVTGLGVADTAWALPAVLVASLGFTVVGCIWWLYFDRLDETVVARAYAGNAHALVRGFGWAYGHVAIYTTLTVAAVGIELAIGAAGASVLPGGARAALCGGAAGALLAITAVQITAATPARRTMLAVRSSGVVAVLLVGWAGSRWSATAVVGTIAIVFVVVTAAESLVMARSRAGTGDGRREHTTSG